MIVSDILCVNKGFAQAQPNMVKGLVHGLLEGNRLLREEPDKHLPVVAKAFGWSAEKAQAELGRVKTTIGEEINTLRQTEKAG